VATALKTRLVAVPGALCGGELLAQVARLTGGVTAVRAAGIWLDDRGNQLAEAVTLVLMSGGSPEIDAAIGVLHAHLAANGEHAMYVLHLGSARIRRLNA